MTKTKLQKILFILTAAIVTLLFAGLASAATVVPGGSNCAISPSLNYPLAPDTDCDGFIDAIDNCPFITNPFQQDSDGNGLGDVCDLFVEGIGVNPADFVYTGRAFNVVSTFRNNRPYVLDNVRVKVIVPELGIETVQYIDHISTCESKSIEFMLRAPICAPESEQKIYVEATFTNDFGVQEKIGGVTSVRIIPDEHCVSLLNGGEFLGKTFVDVMEIQDVYKGSEAVYPMKISNREFASKDYVISVTGLDGYGTSRITPNSLIVVPGQSDRIVDLYVSANDDAIPGEHTFVVTMQDGDEIQRFILIADIKEKPTENRLFLVIFAFKWVLITLLVILLIAAIVFGFMKFVSIVRKDIRKSRQEN